MLPHWDGFRGGCLKIISSRSIKAFLELFENPSGIRVGKGLKMNKNLFKGKNAGVIGLAKSGIAAANLLKSLGANVLVSESNTKILSGKRAKELNKGIEIEYGGHSDKLLGMDLVIKSPGVHPDLKILKELKIKKIPVWSELDLALSVSKPRKLLAITGTNGKTTVTTLLGEIFKAAKEQTIVAGNIGSPLAGLADKIGSKTAVILECSSYQLEDSVNLHPNVCCILNVTEDHIEHHHSMANYIKAKERIFLNQTKNDYCVLNYDDKRCRNMAAKIPSKVLFFSRKNVLKQGVFVSGGNIVFNFKERNFKFPIKLNIPGPHNIENALASAAMSAAAGIKPYVIQKVLESFKGVDHRIEFVREINGVKYINDSKSTNVDSTNVALQSFDEPIWLILGGRDKGFPYTPLRKLVKDKVKGIFLVGESSKKIKKDLSGTTRFYESKTIENAVKRSLETAKPGDVVLLSPACASFDQFKDFEDRGRQFKKIVKNLTRQSS
jgi:UDP-N-acetylmuramoylalanine--D-glutamate ligase